ncbi:MAG: S1 RNA-binding domain-containing protein, partial [Myxococcota bacterium]
KEPLDRSAVHPERYSLVAKIAQDAGISLAKLVGDAGAVGRIDWTKYVDDEVGHPTLNDIASELKKPGRDPRDAFEAPSFAEGIETLEDVQTGMQLDGVVTNVTNFGAFVDVGVHQDGLVHVSQLADRFVSDPADVVRVGDRVKVRVLDVDLGRRRLSLSMRAE